MLALRRYLEEHVFGIAPVASGEDTRWSLRFALGWPDWVVLLFVLAAVALVVGIYLREGTRASRTAKLLLAAVRLGVIGLLILMIGGLELAIDRTGLPYLVLMADDSESMSVRDAVRGDDTAAEGPTRLQGVQQWLARDDGAVWRELTERYKLQLYAQSAAPRLLGSYIAPEDVDRLLADAAALTPTGGQSRQGDNLRGVLDGLRGTPPSAVVSFTDGVTTDGEPLSAAAVQAVRKRVPVFAVGVGDPAEQKDRELSDLLVDEVVFVDDLITFEAKLGSRGIDDPKATVSLRREDRDAVLARTDVTLPPAPPTDAEDGAREPARRTAPVRLAWQAREPGTYTFELTVPPVDGEVRTDNNTLVRQVQVLKEKVRVLYVDSFPRYEFRYLKNLLEREQTVDLKIVLLDSDLEYRQQDLAALSAFPTSREELFEYDVLLFGDVSLALLRQDQLENVRDFVKVKGGGFLLIAGPYFAPASYRDSPLEEVLPVELLTGDRITGAEDARDGFVPRLTPEGRTSPMFRFAADEAESLRIWNSLPPVFRYVPVAKAKPGAAVLVEHPTARIDGEPVALVATQFYGGGRSVFQGFDSTWRWRYRTEDKYHGKYWVQTVRYLARSKLLGQNRLAELTVDRRQYRRGEPVRVRVRFLDPALAPREGGEVTATLEHDAYGPRRLPLTALPGRPTVFEGVFNQARDGRYRVRLSDPVLTAGPDKAAPATEFLVVAPPGEMDRLRMDEPELRQVAEATGGAFFPLSSADEILDLLPRGRRVALQTDPPLPLWNTWPVLLLFIGLLALEWIVRKRLSMA